MSGGAGLAGYRARLLARLEELRALAESPLEVDEGEPPCARPGSAVRAPRSGVRQSAVRGALSDSRCPRAASCDPVSAVAVR